MQHDRGDGQARARPSPQPVSTSTAARMPHAGRQALIGLRCSTVVSSPAFQVTEPWAASPPRSAAIRAVVAFAARQGLDVLAQGARPRAGPKSTQMKRSGKIARRHARSPGPRRKPTLEPMKAEEDASAIVTAAPVAPRTQQAPQPRRGSIRREKGCQNAGRDSMRSIATRPQRCTTKCQIWRTSTTTDLPGLRGRGRRGPHGRMVYENKGISRTRPGRLIIKGTWVSRAWDCGTR